MIINFTKGQGTGNDFVIIEDLDNDLDLNADLISKICDRHFGIGADGLLRVVKTNKLIDKGNISNTYKESEDYWFMDYYNADGSIAEMCGNGLRVYAKYLKHKNLELEDQFYINTRSGLKFTQILSDNIVKVCLGNIKFETQTTVKSNNLEFKGFLYNVGNPHIVVPLDENTELESLNMYNAPVYDSSLLPEGTNIEFYNVKSGQINMRVYERGVGETLSCGTGIVATAKSFADINNTYDDLVVNVPGGTLTVSFNQDSAYLSGPAILVYSGKIDINSQK